MDLYMKSSSNKKITRYEIVLKASSLILTSIWLSGCGTKFQPMIVVIKCKDALGGVLPIEIDTWCRGFRPTINRSIPGG